MKKPRNPFIPFILFAALAAAGAEAQFTPVALEGDTFIHDPSTIIKDGTNYFIFGTGWGLTSKSSPDLIHWQAGDPVFHAPPASTTRFVPGFHGHLWAPDIIRVHGKFLLYYAASSLGKRHCERRQRQRPNLVQLPLLRRRHGGPFAAGHWKN